MQVCQNVISTLERMVSKSVESRWLDRFMRANTQALEILFDRLNGINTRGVVTLKDLGVDEEERVHYVPSGWLTLIRLSKIITFSEQDVFVDFGAGKGRVVVMAARYFPFKKVIGVEIAPDLSRIAQDNVDKNRRKLKCKSVEVVTNDVLQYEIPPDITIAYLYSPFTGSIFREVIDRIGSTLKHRDDRRLWVVLQRPKNSPSSAIYNANNEVLQNCRWLKQVDEIVGRSSLTTIYQATQA